MGNMRWDPASRVSCSLPKRSVLAHGFITRERIMLCLQSAFVERFCECKVTLKTFCTCQIFELYECLFCPSPLQTSLLICNVGRGQECAPFSGEEVNSVTSLTKTL